MSGNPISNPAWRLRACVAAAVLAAIGLFGAASPSRTSRLHLALSDCGNSVTISDSNRAMLLVLDPQARRFLRLDQVQPDRSVVGQVLFRCDLGGFFYTSEERNSSSATSVLHVRVDGVESTVKFKEGINHLIPAGGDELLVQTKVIRHASIDPTLGSLPRDEARRIPLPKQASPTDSPEDFPPNTHVYLEDVVLDANTLQRVRSLRGTLMSHRLQAGRLVTYSMDGTAHAFDPLTGRRTTLHSGGRLVGSIEPDGQRELQPWAQFYAWGDQLFAVNAQSPPAVQPSASLLPVNTVLRFDDSGDRWVPVADLGFRPDTILMAGEQLVMAGGDRFAVFNLASGRLQLAPLALKGLEPSAIASVDAGWLLALTEPSDLPDKYRPTGTQLWLVSRDDFQVKLVHRLEWMGPVRLSTHATPVPGW